ncbi:hypothetical protein EDD37DRAFT_605044 [Exophiala viscosa]|uniref:uncharacterized protein n=1 Tax=Exophiala viscosa TaxID=2486360 RepID=UPI00219CAA16|nr:hypothetical protein EDD37DRAFT_605044 [Exophiala viscosa]
MTSLIFGSIYMGHKTLMKHKRDKQRQKNYERWEGLRDDYDEQRKITRESRSLDIQRTGGTSFGDDTDRPILTLRDQQEAGDARGAWRPQETEDGPGSRLPVTDNRRLSVEVTSGSNLRPLTGHKTGTTWDEGLPQPLRVARRNWEDHQSPGANVSRSSSLRNASGVDTPDRHTSSNAPSGRPSPVAELAAPATAPHPHASRAFSTPAELPHYQSVEPIQNERPGGMMAELIELGDTSRPAPYSAQHPPPQSFGGYQSNPYGFQAPTGQPPAQPADGGMQEWWNQPR